MLPHPSQSLEQSCFKICMFEQIRACLYALRTRTSSHSLHLIEANSNEVPKSACEMLKHSGLTPREARLGLCVGSAVASAKGDWTTLPVLMWHWGFIGQLAARSCLQIPGVNLTQMLALPVLLALYEALQALTCSIARAGDERQGVACAQQHRACSPTASVSLHFAGQRNSSKTSLEDCIGNKPCTSLTPSRQPLVLPSHTIGMLTSMLRTRIMT